MIIRNYVGKWLISLPCHHPKWPRYCTRCNKLAAGCIATKTLSLAVPVDYKDVIVNKKLGRITSIHAPLNLIRERVIIPAKPGTCINFNLTACIECKFFFINKKDRKSEHIKGIFGAVISQWGLRLLPIDEYATQLEGCDE